MNFRNDKEVEEGAAYMVYLKRKLKIFQAALSLVSNDPRNKEAMHVRVFTASKYAPYMEKLKNKLCDLTGLDLSFAEVDMIYTVILEGAKANNKKELRKLEILKHRRELRAVNKAIGLEDDDAHLEAITRLMLGINPLDKDQEEQAKNDGILTDEDEEFFKALDRNTEDA